MTALLLLLLAAAPAPNAEALRGEAARDYHAKRYEDACRKFADAARLRPRDAALASDLGLCLFRLDRRDEAVSETRRAIALAPPEGGVEAWHVRRGAYFNLALMSAALPVPEAGSCVALTPAPGCATPLHACAYEGGSGGTGGRSGGTFLLVARDAARARATEAQRGDLDLGVSEAVAAEVEPDASRAGADVRAVSEPLQLVLEEFEEQYVGKCIDFASRICWETDGVEEDATACVKRRGCKDDPWACPQWSACVDEVCPAEAKRKQAEQVGACNLLTPERWSCHLVAADACLGVAATVCEKTGARPPRRVVHEVLLPTVR